MSLKSATMLRASRRSVRTSISATRVVPVGMLADAVVVEQAMAVAELDAFGDGVHVRIWGSKSWVQGPGVFRRAWYAWISSP